LSCCTFRGPLKQIIYIIHAPCVHACLSTFASEGKQYTQSSLLPENRNLQTPSYNSCISISFNFKTTCTNFFFAGCGIGILISFCYTKSPPNQQCQIIHVISVLSTHWSFDIPHNAHPYFKSLWRPTSNPFTPTASPFPWFLGIYITWIHLTHLLFKYKHRVTNFSRWFRFSGNSMNGAASPWPCI
jgi:hypothetical protein